MEVQYNLFNEIITFLNNAPNTKESPTYIWGHPKDIYPYLEQEIEHNLVMLEPQQQSQYIAYLVDTTSKSISNHSDVLNELIPFFEKYGTSEQKLQDFDTSGHEVVHDAFNLEIPNSLTIKYEHIQEDQITFSRLLQRHFARKSLIWLNEKLLEYVNKYNTNEATPSNTPFELSLRGFELLMETFDYGDSEKRPTYLFFMLFVDRFVSFKDEFNTNMIYLSFEQRWYYIEKLLIKLTNEIQHIGVGEAEVLERCKEYGISLDELKSNSSIARENSLYQKLNIFPQYYTMNGEFDTPRDIMVLQEEFYHYFYGEGIRQIVEFLNQEKSKLQMLQNPASVLDLKKVSEKNPSKSNILDTGFGFTGSTSKLLMMLKFLQQNLEKDLVNESHCTIEALYIILTASDFAEDSPKIYFSCETTQLAYLLKKLKPYFKNFDDSQIEAAGLFFTRKPAALTAVNIRKSYSDTPKPKNFDIIDSAVALLNQ